MHAALPTLLLPNTPTLYTRSPDSSSSSSTADAAATKGSGAAKPSLSRLLSPAATSPGEAVAVGQLNTVSSPVPNTKSRAAAWPGSSSGCALPRGSPDGSAAALATGAAAGGGWLAFRVIRSAPKAPGAAAAVATGWNVRRAVGRNDSKSSSSGRGGASSARTVSSPGSANSVPSGSCNTSSRSLQQ